MISHLLDTNACIALINGKPLAIRRKLEEVITAGGVVAASSIALSELWYGVEKNTKIVANRRRRHVIGAYDTLIAPQASRLECIVVTANTREFKRVAGLAVEDWTRK